jgi:hypothetical protein
MTSHDSLVLSLSDGTWMKGVYQNTRRHADGTTPRAMEKLPIASPLENNNTMLDPDARSG